MDDTGKSHEQRAKELAAKVGGQGLTDKALRVAAMERAWGGDAMSAPYEDLVHSIDEASYRVTDAQVGAVRQATGSDKGAFEIVFAACAGAGLARWDAAGRAIEEAEREAR